MDLRFLPADAGRTSGVIEFYYDGIGSPAKVQLYGEGLAFKKVKILEDTINFGRILVNTDTTIYGRGTIKNIGVESVKINDISINNNFFSRLQDIIDSNLNIGDTAKFDLKYSPKKVGVDTASMIFILDTPNDSVYIVRLIGESYDIPPTPIAKICVNNISAYPGDTVVAEIQLLDVANIPNGDKYMFDIDLQYNSTLLSPLDYIFTSVGENKSKLTLKSIPIGLKSEKTIAKIPFRVGLGDSESSDLILSNIDVKSANVNILSNNGKFTLLGICREGGDRLFNPTGKAGIVSVTPNPAKDKITIEVNNIEDGDVNLAIYNSMGVEVQSIKIDNKQGKQIINVDFSEYSCGMYYVRYKSSSICDYMKIVISK
jgi:hypothetical protein